MANTVNIGVIGAGRIGKVHTKTLATMVPGVRVTAISDVVPEAAKSLAAEFGVEKASADHQDIINDKNIDAVVICSSTDTHAAFIEEAANAGKHVFCEKPIALELAKIDAALAAVKKAGVILMVGFNRRFDQGNMRIRDAVVHGMVGTPEMCVISSRDPAPPPLAYVKVSGGLFLDMMIHDFDLARYLLNDEPVSVYADAGCLVSPEIGKAGDVDTAMVTIRFSKGALCHINNSRRAVYGYDQRAEVFGSKGMMATKNLHEDNTVLALEKGYSEPPIMNFFMSRYIPAYQEEGKCFAECIRDGKTPPSDGYDGRISVLMGYAAMKSVKEKRPVAIDEVNA